MQFHWCLRMKYMLLYAGGYPYPTISDKDILRYLISGKRLEKPENCTDEMQVHLNWRDIFRVDFSYLSLILNHMTA